MPNDVPVQIAGKTIQLPLFVDQKTTQNIANQVTERMKAIESRADRIDTQAFALQAAFEFASEYIALQEEQEAENRDLMKAMDALTTRLKDLVETHQTDT